MKKNFKRLFALVLTLCMLASLMVPVAFAEDEAVAAPSANVAETYPIRLVDMTQLDHTTATGWNTSFKSSSGYKNMALKSSDGTLNATLTGKIDAAYADGSLDWKFLDSEGEAIYRLDRMFQLRSSGWVAFQIRVSASGLYSLNIATDKNDPAEGAAWSNLSKEAAGNVAAYIVPLADLNQAIEEGATFSTADGANDWVYPTVGEVIPNLLTDDYSVGTAAMAAEDTSVTFAKQRMEAGEYVVIYDGPNTYSVSDISLLGDAYEMENVATYDMNPFDLTNLDPATYAGTANENLVTAATDDAGVTTYTFKDYVTPGTGIDYDTFGWASYTYSGTWRAQADAKYDPCLKSAGNWAAIKLNVPASGEQYLSLTTDRMDVSAPFSNSFGKSIIATVSAYLIPAADVASKDAVAGLIEAGTGYIGTRSLFSTEDKTMTFDKAFLEAGQYVLVIKLEAVEDGRYPISEISLDKIVVEELPGNDKLSGTIATYDFEIYNNERYAPIFTYENGTTGGRGWGNGAFSGLEGAYEAGTSVKDILAADYDAGIHNFKLETLGTITASNFEGDLTDTDTGLRIQKKYATETAESQYMALRINVPATALYNVTLNASYYTVTTLNIYTYSADAEGDVAANMTEDNLAASFTSGNNLSFNKMLTAGDNIIVFEIDETTAKETLRLTSIVLNIAGSETVTYDFALSNNEAFMNAWKAANGDTETAVPDGTNLYKWTGTSATFYPYSAIASAFASGDINWALGASSGSNLCSYSAGESKNFRVGATNLRLLLENSDSTLNYTSFHLNVPQEGSFDITVNYTKTSDSFKVYLFKSPVSYDSYGDRLYLGADADGNERDASLQLTTYMTAENLVHSTSTYSNPEVNFNYDFEEAGEYVIVFAPVRTDKTTSAYISSIVMEPVAINYLADGEGYETFEEAVANATESIALLQDTIAGDVVVPAGVTLDLNGYNLDAASVEFAAAADIIDSADGKALLRSGAEITFNEDNAQLPLYDIDANTYKLFNVEVESSATTGSGSATKYWFKVNFSNAAALDMIGQFTELRIQADMTGVIKADSGDYVAGDEWAAVAYADVAFSNSWAANSNSYIVVSAVGSNLSSFTLNPGITANGVVISGDTMYKGSAT